MSLNRWDGHDALQYVCVASHSLATFDKLTRALNEERCIRVTMSAWQASDAAAREQLERVVEVLVTERCRTMEDCIEWARKKFQASSDVETSGCPGSS